MADSVGDGVPQELCRWKASLANRKDQPDDRISFLNTAVGQIRLQPMALFGPCLALKLWANWRWRL